MKPSATEVSDLIESYRRERGNLRAHVAEYLARQKRRPLPREPIRLPDTLSGEASTSHGPLPG